MGDDRYECTSVVCGLVWFSKEENDDPTGNQANEGQNCSSIYSGRVASYILFCQDLTNVYRLAGRQPPQDIGMER